MLKAIVWAAMIVAACAAPERTVPFAQALSGEATSDLKVSIEGTLDTTGIDFYSLFASRGDIRGSACIALILTDAGRKKAKQLNEKRVLVRGKLLFLADLNTLLPDQSGKINGRIWAGTRCTGETAIYVSELRTKSGS